MLRLVFVSLLAMFASFSLPAMAQEKVALVVGVAEYGQDRELREAEGFIVPAALANAVRDAELVSEALKAQGFDVMTLRNPDKRALRTGVNAFSQKIRESDGETLAVFYFAGHGAQGRPQFERDIDNYLIPVNADLISEVDLESEALGLSRISEALTPGPEDSIVIILDACRDFALPQKSRSSMATRGLVEQRAKPGTLIAYSTTPGEVAFDGDRGGNGPYATALATELKAAGGRRLEDIFINVRNSVLDSTQDQQLPWENSSLRRRVRLGEGPDPDARLADRPPPEPTRKASYTVDPQSLSGSTLWANVDGLDYEIEAFEYALVDVEHVKDFNADGTLDALIAIHSGGNCCPPEYAFVIDLGDGHFVKEPVEDVYAWESPTIEVSNGRWAASFVSINEGMNTDEFNEEVTLYTVEGAKPFKISSSGKKEAAAIVELHSSQFDMDKIDQPAQGFSYDFNGDGKEDALTCEFWSRWGRLTSCRIALAASNEAVSVSESCKRLGVLKATSNGYANLVCDANQVLLFDPATRRYSPKAE